MPVASGSAQTRFGIAGWGTRRAGSFAGKTASVVTWVDLSNKRWVYTVASWSADVAFYFEASMKAVSGTVRARLFDITRNEAVTLGEVTSTDTSYDTLRTQALNLGNHVGSQFKAQGGSVPSDSGEVDGADMVMI